MEKTKPSELDQNNVHDSEESNLARDVNKEIFVSGPHGVMPINEITDGVDDISQPYGSVVPTGIMNDWWAESVNAKIDDRKAKIDDSMFHPEKDSVILSLGNNYVAYVDKKPEITRETRQVKYDPLNLFTEEQQKQLIINGREECRWNDIEPVALLITLRDKNQYLLTGVNPENTNIGYGIRDVKNEEIEIGEIDLHAMMLNVFETEKEFNPDCVIPDDGDFKAKYKITDYLRMSREAGHLVTHDPAHEEMIRRYFKPTVLTGFPTLMK